MNKQITELNSNKIFNHEFTVAKEEVDQYEHVNNVVYVKWMQDVAILHSESTGGAEAVREANGRWVARSHRIEYLSPAFAGEDVIALTWVVNFRRVRSLRRYSFLRKNDKKLLARGETEWIFLDAATGRPRTIPVEVIRAFSIMPEYEEPRSLV